MNLASGKLFVVASPLGNLADFSLRALETLKLVDYWIVEDTRVSGKLQTHFNLQKPMLILNEHTLSHKLEEYVSLLSEGKTAAVLTDAGVPGISDPGSMLVDLCYQSGIAVDALPGPSAVTTALMLSG